MEIYRIKVRVARQNTYDTVFWQDTVLCLYVSHRKMPNMQ
jgi:hypothetical protein